MKTLYFLLMLVFFLSCTESGSQEGNNILGSWKLIETFNDDGSGNGGNVSWQTVSDELSYTIQFEDNSTFKILNSSTNCYFGEYNIIDYVLTLTFSTNSCNVSKYNIDFSDNYLLLNGSPFSCDEACIEKFEKLNDQCRVGKGEFHP